MVDCLHPVSSCICAISSSRSNKDDLFPIFCSPIDTTFIISTHFIACNYQPLSAIINMILRAFDKHK